MSSELHLDVCCRCCGGDIWGTHTKERQAWCYLQVKLCDPRLSALSVVATIKALYKYILTLPYLTLPCAVGPLSVLSVLSYPICDVCALWPNGWTDQDETWHTGRPQPWPHCARWGPSSPSSKGAQPPPNFRPISVAAKWLHGSRCHLVWS